MTMKTALQISNTARTQTNDILLTYRSKLLADGSNERRTPAAKVFTATILKNVEALGFTFSNDLTEVLLHSKEAELEAFYDSVLPLLKKAVGAHRKYTPMYPNFPRQVMEADAAELYINAIMHYLGDWVGLRITPEYKKEKRPKLIEAIDLRVLSLGTTDDLHEIMANTMASKTSISAADVENVKWYIKQFGEKALRSPLNIPHKEVMAVVVRACLENGVKTDKFAKITKTIGDVVRIAVSLSDGDVSLASAAKFKKFKRSHRKVLLSMAEHLDVNNDDLNKYRGQLVRLGEVIHPGEYKSKYPQAFKLFDLARNSKLPTSVGKIEIALAADKIKTAMKLLAEKPGQFARRLDHLLRKSDNQNSVISEFAAVASSVSPTVLLQAYSHFKNRSTATDRLVFPKGEVAKAKCIGAPIGTISQYVIEKVLEVIEAALITQFAAKPKLGRVFIDPKLKNFLVPFSQRTASKALKTIVRGSRVSLADLPGDILRSFVWWKQPEDQRTDLDISGGFYDAKWKLINNISFRDLRCNYCTHSGDITSAPNGAAEFIDIDINKAIKAGVRYAYITVRSYTNNNFCDLPECFAGVMQRKDQHRGEIFDARTVKTKFDIASEATVGLPFVIDLNKREMIWADLANPNESGYWNTIESDAGTTVKVLQNLITMDRFNLYDLFMLHAKARGDITLNEKEADLVLSTENETHFQTDRIISEFL